MTAVYKNFTGRDRFKVCVNRKTDIRFVVSY